MKDKPIASLSLDLDNLWSYQKVHGDKVWRDYSSYLPIVVPIVDQFLKERDLTITFFVVGRDAADPTNGDALRRLAEDGHEFGNHSFSHEPWMQRYDETKVDEEIGRAEEAIEQATGCKPLGFRGPGYARSAIIAETLLRRGYDYDASTLPSTLGPLARLYYFWGAKLSSKERKERGDLFGSWRDGLTTLKPFEWDTSEGRLLSIPITTVPIMRVPFHFSYLLYLARYSPGLAGVYFRFALGMSKLRGIEPSMLLHPLDFLGKEDAPELAFFPGMGMPREQKLSLMSKMFDIVLKRFRVVPMSEHVRLIRQRGALKPVSPPSWSE